MQAYFDLKPGHIIQVDWSLGGLGSDLLQKGRPVIYASRKLTPAETWYSTIERELLSVVFGSKIKVQTDDKPLIPIWKKSIAGASP